MKTFCYAAIAALTLGAAVTTSRADGLDSLTAFLQNASAGRAEFTQTVSAPAKDGQHSRAKTSSGTFEFARPGRFRFEYKKPYVQTLVADGQTLWIHDPDLNQVTARKQAQILGSTPAALLAAAPNMAALKKDYELSAAPEQDGLTWVLAQPRTRDGQVQSVRIGFRGAELTALDILDSFGQRSVLRFSKVELNPKLAAETFVFKPPPGADVIKQE